jgi:hypothetical protein
MQVSLTGLAGFLLLAPGAVGQWKYEVEDRYLPGDFFDKFDFFESKYGTGNAQDIDPTQGFVNYRSREFSEASGLISTTAEGACIYANHKDVFDGSYGRDSVRIESKQSYTHGLFVWTFDHLPAPTCGAWPAVWSYGPDWPNNGEMDVYENWNLASDNLITGHTNGASSCTISQANFSGIEGTPDCNTYASTQYYGQGCSVTEENGQWGQTAGGVYAMEWTSDAISVWSWPVAAAPLDVQNSEPDPSSWGEPHFQIVASLCNLDQMFANHKLVLNIDFCGTTAGNPTVWSLSGCPIQKYPTCQSYVAANPQAFANVYYQVRGIDIYTTVSVSTTTTTSNASHATSSVSNASSTVTTSTSTSTSSASVLPNSSTSLSAAVPPTSTGSASSSPPAQPTSSGSGNAATTTSTAVTSFTHGSLSAL